MTSRPMRHREESTLIVIVVHIPGGDLAVPAGLPIRYPLLDGHAREESNCP